MRRFRRSPAVSRGRFRLLSSGLDRLEERRLLSTVSTLFPQPATSAYPLYELSGLVSNTSPPTGAYTPSQIAQAYGFNKVSFGSVKGDGSGQTIAIVDAYDDPNIQVDLNVFSSQFGLAPTTITKVNQSGGSTVPAADPTGGWELETALDVEWAHAIAPGAKILLVEANSANDNDLLAAVNYAAAHANVVSMSWGGSEFLGESSYDGYFNKSGVVFVASSGDSGAPGGWPSISPNILAVGGTSLTTTSDGTYVSESGWSGSGGGPSLYVSQPSYQKGVVTQTTTQRANPDVSYDASPSTGFAVYDSYAYNRTSYGWVELGGTSAGAPQWAALVAIADQGRALTGQAPLNSTNPQEIQTILYQNRSAFHDVTTGASTGSPRYSATAGYDYVTGLGSPYADRVVAALTGTSTTTAVDSLSVTAQASATAGASFSVTVTAKTAAGAVDSSYLGTVQFTSTDTRAGLPSSYTFTAADHGSHTFTVTLFTAGSRTLSVSDANGSATSGTTSSISVSPAAASRFILSGLSTSTTAGATQTLTVTAQDPYGNVATGYTGTVILATSDPQGSAVPSSYTFTAADRGVHNFSVSFKTAGIQSVTVSDSVAGIAATLAGISVTPAAPSGLTATAASNSQINLAWTGSVGATGYIIQRSTSGSGGWTQVGTTAAGTTTYSDTNLTAGTTYYYRIQATGGSGSAFGNTATATTTGGTVSTTTYSAWGNGYTPSVNAYSYGSYEVGLKFSSSVSGMVTGVRFYKEPWMGGVFHVGHLWSSTGALLATAFFTGETFSGWQQVSFASPVSISANTTYTISFTTGGGYFGITTNSFGTTSTNGPLQIPANAGVFGYSGAFPTYSSGGLNFWADVVFAPSSTASVSPKTTVTTKPVGIAVLASGSTSTHATGTQTASARAAVVTSGTYPYRRSVNQAPAFSGTFSKRF